MVTVQIKTTKKEFFSNWLEWMAPKIPLKGIDRKVFSTLLTLYHENAHRFGDPKTLNSLIFSTETKSVLVSKTRVTPGQLSKALKNLTGIGAIINQGGTLQINPYFTNRNLSDLQKINVVFTIENP